MWSFIYSNTLSHSSYERALGPCPACALWRCWELFSPFWSILPFEISRRGDLPLSFRFMAISSEFRIMAISSEFRIAAISLWVCISAISYFRTCRWLSSGLSRNAFKRTGCLELPSHDSLPVDDKRLSSQGFVRKSASWSADLHDKICSVPSATNDLKWWYFTFMCFVRGLMAGDFAMLMAPELSSKSLHLTVGECSTLETHLLYCWRYILWHEPCESGHV
jgi:hypothetical protein